MSDEKIVYELTRMSIDLEFSKGQPPEEAMRMALEMLLVSLSRAVKYSVDADYFFPIAFPMDMTLESEQLRWSFRLVARLKNVFADKIKE